MTFSITARCAATGQFGVAVSSSSPAVAARCAHARAGVGAVASQNVTDPTLGPKALGLMERGATAAEAVAILVRTQPHMAYRQVTAVDRNGQNAIHSGENVLGTHSQTLRENLVCAGNLLADEGVTTAMADAFEASGGHLGDRLIATMMSALDAGGEEGPVHSAGMYIVDQTPFPLVDLRVDWREGCPVTALGEAWEVYRPQMHDYVTRALSPDAAPNYGVPGDD
ncbi:MAG: DUF1028 domain-containing protein [Pseudomonadota bacterium]